MRTRDPGETLILDLLEWIGPRGRPYAETLDAWKTSCPRLTIWEDADDRGLVVRHRTPKIGPVVSLSPAGIAYLRAQRPLSTTAAIRGSEAGQVTEDDAAVHDRTGQSPANDLAPGLAERKPSDPNHGSGKLPMAE